MVCGSIGYGGVEHIREFYSILSKEGFDVLRHVEEKSMDYSDIQDFRDKRELSKEIVNHDLEYVKKADVIVVMMSKTPSYGTWMEMYVAKMAGKKVILVANEPIPTPWPIHFSDYIVRDTEELIKKLHELNSRK